MSGFKCFRRFFAFRKQCLYFSRGKCEPNSDWFCYPLSAPIWSNFSCFFLAKAASRPCFPLAAGIWKFYSVLRDIWSPTNPTLLGIRKAPCSSMPIADQLLSLNNLLCNAHLFVNSVKTCSCLSVNIPNNVAIKYCKCLKRPTQHVNMRRPSWKSVEILLIASLNFLKGTVQRDRSGRN